MDMFRNSELDRIKVEERNVFERKQEAWAIYMKAKKKATAAHALVEEAKKARNTARKELNGAYVIWQEAIETYQDVWGEYTLTRDNNNREIKKLKEMVEHENREMRRCFELAESSYEYGDYVQAEECSEEGNERKARRDRLNADICALRESIKESKEHAMECAPKPNDSEFKAAKEKFDQAKERHLAAQKEFEQARKERDRLKTEFEVLQEKHTSLKAEFKQKLEEVKAANKHSA